MTYEFRVALVIKINVIQGVFGVSRSRPLFLVLLQLLADLLFLLLRRNVVGWLRPVKLIVDKLFFFFSFFDGLCEFIHPFLLVIVVETWVFSRIHIA